MALPHNPLAIDLFCGLGGWTDGLLAEGYGVIGFDIEQHVYGEHRYPAQLVLQDVLTLHGSQFKDAALIVASPPCQEYSYMAMPWTLAKQKIRDYEDGTRDRNQLTALFDACFRIQREACEAAGRHIPLVVENVRGAQRWVGRAKWNFGSFYLWGDVPALMPITFKAIKVPSFRFDGNGGSFQSASVRRTSRDCGIEATGIKQGGDWFNAASLDGDGMQSISRRSGSKSPTRKAASMMIAKIPLVLSSWIAKSYYPELEFSNAQNQDRERDGVRATLSDTRGRASHGKP